MIRILARHLVCDEVSYGLSLVTIDEQGNLTIEDFDHETHSTRYVDGQLVINTRPGQFPEILVDGRLMSTCGENNNGINAANLTIIPSSYRNNL